jgi:hypothetical protein
MYIAVYFESLSTSALLFLRVDTNMHSINRFLYGPTPEERVRSWQAKLRAESRQLDREMRQVGSDTILSDSDR